MSLLRMTKKKINPEITTDVDKEFKNIYKDTLSYLLEKAPSDASLKSQVSKIKKGYEGVIEIFSSQRKFLASAICTDPNELASELVNQIHSQILKWRNDRVLLLR